LPRFGEEEPKTERGRCLKRTILWGEGFAENFKICGALLKKGSRDRAGTSQLLVKTKNHTSERKGAQ